MNTHLFTVQVELNQSNVLLYYALIIFTSLQKLWVGKIKNYLDIFMFFVDQVVWKMNLFKYSFAKYEPSSSNVPPPLAKWLKNPGIKHASICQYFSKERRFFSFFTISLRTLLLLVLFKRAVLARYSPLVFMHRLLFRLKFLKSFMFDKIYNEIGTGDTIDKLNEPIGSRAGICLIIPILTKFGVSFLHIWYRLWSHILETQMRLISDFENVMSISGSLSWTSFLFHSELFFQVFRFSFN